MTEKVYYYYLNKGEETVINDTVNKDIIETISYDFYEGNNNGVIIKELEYKNSNIILWAVSESELKELIKKEKEKWVQFSKEIKEDKDVHHIQFEKLSDQFNIDGNLFILSLLRQTSYP